MANVGSGDDRFAPGTIPLAATAASVHTVERRSSGGVYCDGSFWRMRQRAKAQAEPDRDDRNVADAIVSSQGTPETKAIADGPTVSPQNASLWLQRETRIAGN